MSTIVAKLVDPIVTALVTTLVVVDGGGEAPAGWQLLKQTDGQPVKQDDGSDIFVRTH